MNKLTPISFRTGFATNSSSSHAIIMSNNGAFPANEVTDGEYGWEWFVNHSYESKLTYIYVAIGSHFIDIKGFADFLDIPVSDVENLNIDLDDSYIDHDSVGLINKENAKMILKNDNLAIRGGNDNDDVPTYLEKFEELNSETYSAAIHALEQLTDDKPRVVAQYNNAKVVAEKEVVTVFYPFDGLKIRYSVVGTDEVYLSFPELVDIKITDYCPYGCEYCYQNSTVEGKHASLESLKDMADFLSENGTFELAIGGGEPTLHPDFDEYVKYVSEETDLTLNYTTRNTTFFKKHINEMIDHFNCIGGFAYSIDEPKDITRYMKVIEYWVEQFTAEINRGKLNPMYGYVNRDNIDQLISVIRKLAGKVSFQIVLGALSREDYITLAKALDNFHTTLDDKFSYIRDQLKSWRDIIHENTQRNVWSFCPYVRTTVMLLGYKTTGRGSQPEYYYHNNALSDIEFILNKFDIGIDTSAAQHLTTELKKYNIDERTYYIKEGVASCYIDAVANTMADSSYGTMIDLDVMDTYDTRTFTETFNGYQKRSVSTIPILMVE